jgi:iron-sulfur cluster assembly protein
MITVTEAAKNRVIELLAEEKKDDTYFLRVGVKGGGCSGLSYVLEFDNKEQEFDETFEDKDIKIVCDRKSILYLFGTELDFSSGLNGKGFEFKNPQADRTCGCGQSFSV